MFALKSAYRAECGGLLRRTIGHADVNLRKHLSSCQLANVESLVLSEVGCLLANIS